MRTWLRSFSTAPGLAWKSTLKRQSTFRYFNWYWYVNNCKKVYYRKILSIYLSIFKSQLQIHEGLWQKLIIIISSILGCK